MQEAATSWDLRSLFSFPFFAVATLAFLFAFLVPVANVLRRTGHSALWCLLAIFPGLNLLALWFLAFKPWPTDPQSSNT